MKFSNYTTFSADFWKKGLDEAIKHTVDLGIGYVEHIEIINTITGDSLTRSELEAHITSGKRNK